jgi:hypothetical protein
MSRVLTALGLAAALLVGGLAISSEAQVRVERGFNPIFGFGATTARASGVLSVNTTQAATAANTTETDLWTYTLPANALDQDGKAIRVTTWGTTAATANTKRMRLYVGSTLVADNGATAANNLSWRHTVLIIRTGAAAQVNLGEYQIQNTVSATAGHVASTADTTAAITIKLSGTNGTAAANDIVFRGALVEALN